MVQQVGQPMIKSDKSVAQYPRTFISYRRSDTSAVVQLLFEKLRQKAPGEQFLDLTSIEYGEDVVHAVRSAVANCHTLIAVIGPTWLSAQDGAGLRRLDHPSDWVRVEIATALTRGVRVIPLLIDGVVLPAAEDLPDDLKLLVQRRALRVDLEDLDSAVDRLVHAVRHRNRTPRSMAALILSASVVSFLLVALFLWRREGAAHIHGRVVALDSRSIPGAKVCLIGTAKDVCTVTNGQGWFDLPTEKPPGVKARLKTTAPGYNDDDDVYYSGLTDNPITLTAAATEKR